MTRAPLVLLAVLFFLMPAAACGPGVDLTKALEVTDLLTGYYDSGIKDGKNYLVPSISFRLHNKGTKPIGPVQLSVAFWRKSTDTDWDSVMVQAISARGLAVDETTDSILVRAGVGYTFAGARVDIFSNSMFLDVTAKMFASQAGDIVPIGQFPLDRSIIPHLSPR
jgi:hypothetical protein